MDDPQHAQNAVAAWTGFGLALAALVGQAVKYIVDAMKDRNASAIAATTAKTASDEKVALAKIAVENEKDKADLRTQVAILTEKTAKCEDGHKACEEKSAKLQAEHTALWKEMANVKSVLPPMPPANP